MSPGVTRLYTDFKGQANIYPHLAYAYNLS